MRQKPTELGSAVQRVISVAHAEGRGWEDPVPTLSAHGFLRLLMEADSGRDRDGFFMIETTASEYTALQDAAHRARNWMQSAVGA